MPVKTKGPWDLVEVKAALEPSAPNPRLKDLALPGPPPGWSGPTTWRPSPVRRSWPPPGGKPLLVASPAGPGKVLCFAGTILGYEDKAGGTPFWKWDQYPRLPAVADHLVGEVSNNDHHQAEPPLPRKGPNASTTGVCAGRAQASGPRLR